MNKNINIKKIYSFLIVTTLFFSLSAQSLEHTYQVRAAQVRAEVWEWDNPAFKNYSIPDEFINESAVILARHRQIDATANKTNQARLFWLGENTGKLFYTNIDRSMILINDQTALTAYSEFSFKEKNNFGWANNSGITILGARIIKPDGTIKEIDVSNLSVSITEGKYNKEAYKKLAIPELQISDILDFFVCDIYELSTLNIPEQTIAFFSLDAPALYSSCCLTFGKNLTLEYRSINGAPQFSKTTDPDGNIVLTAESDNIMRINDYDNTRWGAPLRDFPIIRFVVLQNASNVFIKPESARLIGVHENVPYTKIIEDAKHYLEFYNPVLNHFKSTLKPARKIIKKYKKTNPNISKTELADIIYTALNFEWKHRENYDVNQVCFLLLLDYLFRGHGIESKVGVITSKYSARKDEVLSYNDFYYMIVANQGSQYFFPPYRYRVPGEIPPAFQGESVSYYSYSTQGRLNKTVTLPESSAEENIMKSKIQVVFNQNDMQIIEIKRNSLCLGDIKNQYQPWLLLYEDWDKELRRFLKIDKSYMEELTRKKYFLKDISEFENTFEKNRAEHSEMIENEIKLFHGFAPENVHDYTFSNLGVTLENPQLEYDISYTMSDFVHNAGENIIFDAGKLIGQQWDPTENERNRNINAYIPTRKIYTNEIIIPIPDNYTVSNIEHLNMFFSNNYATFESIATIENNTVLIKTSKAYNQTFVPKEDWSMLVDIMDKTNTFYSNSIIFQKINE